MAEVDAAVAILQTVGPEESVLLIRRAEREGDAWSGHWSFPGGRRDPEDADLLDTCLRELEEECGIRLGRDALASALPLTVARRPTGRFLLVAPFVFRVDAQLPAVVDEKEAVEALWVPLRLLLDPSRHGLQCVPGRPGHMLYPAVAFSGPPLWGFTYRLITDWLELCPKDRAAEQAGFEFAGRVLDFLVSQGLVPRHGWLAPAEAGGGLGPEVVRIAAVEGVIPVARVLAHFSAPGRQVPPVNLLDVRPDVILVGGLAFEGYRIVAVK